ncbi:MAG: cupin domain-containing protein [Alphaproteobacteria bacterium]|nr:cupin domain-containing protein [Alphaproteobacteria bacterium]
MEAQEIIDLLGLQPHPEEGGWFVETWRSPEPWGPDPRFASTCLSTAIYYLLAPGSISAMHVLPGEEVFHHYLGDPVHTLLLHPDGRHEVVTLGSDLRAGHRPQLVVPGGVWQGALLAPGGRAALLGTTMAPGFAYADYVHGDIDDLARRWPDADAAIRARAIPARHV